MAVPRAGGAVRGKGRAMVGLRIARYSGGVLAGLLDALAERQRRRATERELRRLLRAGPHLLRDAGVDEATARRLLAEGSYPQRSWEN